MRWSIEQILTTFINKDSDRYEGANYANIKLTLHIITEKGASLDEIGWNFLFTAWTHPWMSRNMPSGLIGPLPTVLIENSTFWHRSYIQSNYTCTVPTLIHPMELYLYCSDIFRVNVLYIHIAGHLRLTHKSTSFVLIRTAHKHRNTISSHFFLSY